MSVTVEDLRDETRKLSVWTERMRRLYGRPAMHSSVEHMTARREVLRLLRTPSETP